MSLDNIKDDIKDDIEVDIKVNLFNNLDRLKEECKEYLDDMDSYVYKICSDHIVVMKKLQDTRTNENRNNVANISYEKFRADKLFVVKIINIDTMQSIKEIVNNNYKIKIIYKCDEIIIPNKFDENIDVVCSFGIHYFKTIDAAFYYKDHVPTNFTGKWICWHENGNKSYECEYIDGKRTGKWISYYENGNKSYEGEYIDGIQTGKWIYLYTNGNKSGEGEYIDGKKTGKWIYWHGNGNKSSEGEYIDGKETGK